MLVASWFDPDKRGCVIGISVSVPKGVRYDKLMPSLYPDWDLVRDWKQGRIPWDQYRERYLAILRSRWNDGLKDEIMSMPDDVTLCCWEKEPQHCHRSIAAEVIGKVRPELEVEVR